MFKKHDRQEVNRPTLLQEMGNQNSLHNFLFASFVHLKSGGGERDRTDDLVNANHALSQLSYTPVAV
jgi:hypothetical protein